MLGAERLFGYRQSALLDWSRRCKVALSPEQEGEAVEGYDRIGTLGAELLFNYRQSALVK
jgi:hypothetical protein